MVGADSPSSRSGRTSTSPNNWKDKNMSPIKERMLPSRGRLAVMAVSNLSVLARQPFYRYRQPLEHCALRIAMALNRFDQS